MMRGTAVFLFFNLTILHFSFAQSAIDHWESLVNAENTWQYFVGTSEPSVDWKTVNFDASSWNRGQGGFGYADNDDMTIISTTISVYIRIKFTITDLTQIESAMLLADYDDGFVAYLNGKEFARSGVSGAPPAYNTTAYIDHEAGLYRGVYPEQFQIDKNTLSDYLVTGENVLAVQVHNRAISSSDLSSNFFLVAGLNVSQTHYQPVPVWFKEPVTFDYFNLPIIKINTNGQGIPDEPKIMAEMGVIDNGPDSLNHIDDPFNDYTGHIGIELRGSSSQMFHKKQYAVELWTTDGRDTTASVLGLPPEEDWILNGPYSDKSLLRNVLAYKLSAEQGWYAPRTRFCELFINDVYKGVYFVTEKIKRDKYRVNINKLRPDENTGDNLTGGYIIKIDKFTGASNGNGWESPYGNPVNNPPFYTYFQYHYPDETAITTQQANYIKNYVTAFEGALKSSAFKDSNKGYRKYINVESFIDYALVQEITRNVDAYRLSTFLYKDKDSKLYIGPVWDFNLGFGNADYCDAANTSGWAWDLDITCGTRLPFWWRRFMEDPNYVLQFKSRWAELRQGPFSNAVIMNYIDSTVLILDEPQQRNFAKWPILDKYIWPNNYVGGSYENEIIYLKNWIRDRLAWMDAKIEAMVVITGIEDNAYHPGNITVFPNPGNGRFSIIFKAMPSSDINVRLFNTQGKMIVDRNYTPAAEITIVSNEKLKSGLYLLKISGGTGINYQEKIIVY